MRPILPTYYHSLFYTCILLFLSFIKGSAQNLFANPGFEDLNNCTEYHAPCEPAAWFYIQPTTNVNSKKEPRALLGTQVLPVAICNVFDPNIKGPFVYTMLACPLEVGRKYKLSFYINCLNIPFTNLDFYFSGKEPSSKDFNTKNISPNFTVTGVNTVNELKQGWIAMECYFVASGNEKFCTIGNMTQKFNYNVDTRMNASGDLFFFLDEIKLSPVDFQSPCLVYQDNIKKMYEQHSRHTEFTLIDSSSQIKNSFITDSINIPSALFETNSAVLKPSFNKMMDNIMNKFSGKEILKIDVTGYTDNIGTMEKNIALSLARAKAVKDFFIKRFPQYAYHILVAGKGQEQPIASNSTEAGRSKNRRVEVIFTIQEE